jgi:hypothetical protein
MIPPQLDTNGLGFTIAQSCTKYLNIFCNTYHLNLLVLTIKSKPMLDLTFNEHTHTRIKLPIHLKTKLFLQVQ